MNPLYPSVALRAKGRCEYCHAPQTAFNNFFEVEHSHPQSQGGTDNESNLALACRSCNGFRAARLHGIDPATGQKEPLFHPRRDQWNEHFAVDPVTLQIHGLTPAGRGTVAALRFNSSEQLIARSLWRQMGAFP